MSGWERLLKETEGFKTISDIKNLAAKHFDIYEVYPESIHRLSNTLFFITRDKCKKVLIIAGTTPHSSLFEGLETACGHIRVKVCPLDIHNSKALFDLFPFTRPRTCKGHAITIGLGDRLGLASPGHLKAVKKYGVFPVLAQQSIRELDLTGRTYEEVLSCAAWAVFQEGFDSGYGADGDHLKNRDEISYALRCGYTRITLDCSDHIRNSILSLSESEINDRYRSLPQNDKSRYEAKYLGRTIQLDDKVKLYYSPATFYKMILLYHEAIEFAKSIYCEFIKPFHDSLDFEISIDETLTETSPEDHYFTASELLDAKVSFDALAPRFCGGFEKGIDYIGDLQRFDKTFDIHSRIAQKLGYRLSVHSGSDKFSVFPFVGERTDGVYHIKTAGTHWLEALRVLAAHAPELYRRIHRYALEHITEAKKFYNISADIAQIPNIDDVSDDELPLYLTMDHSRQILHITYGSVLTAKNSDGSYIFKDDLYQFLDKHEQQYTAALEAHLERHLDALGVKILS